MEYEYDMDTDGRAPSDRAGRGCVMVWHIYNGTQMLGWDNPLMGTSKLITHWMSPPAAPEGGE